MVTIPKGTIKRIHINGALLRKHLKASKPISIKVRRSGKMRTLRASYASIGSSELIYSPNKPLSSGAVLWIETKEEVKYK